jgi:hypothetical protein
MDWVPSAPIGDNWTSELELSARAPVSGEAPRQLFSTFTFDRAVRPWMRATIGGAFVASDGPASGQHQYEVRPQLGVRLAKGGARWRVGEFARYEYRQFFPRGGSAFVQHRLRHRPSAAVVVRGASFSAPHAVSLTTDAEWFIDNADPVWTTNQVRVRATIGWRVDANRVLEVQWIDQRRRADVGTLVRTDGILRFRWRQTLKGWGQHHDADRST